MPFEERLELIRDDQVKGAAFLAQEALLALIDCVRETEGDASRIKEALIEASLRLMRIRPGMPAIGHLVIRAAVASAQAFEKDLSPQALRENIEAEIQQQIKGCREVHEQVVTNASEILRRFRKVLTLSLSSNVLDSLIRLEGTLQRVYVAESRPVYEGRTTAEKLAEAGIPVTLVTDAAMGWALDRVNLCLTGADGVLQDGSLINKTGTHLLALAAATSKIPVYSICETYKYHVGAVPFEPESKPPDEVCPPMPGVEISNLYFEIIPARYIAGYITELGLIPPHLAAEQIRRWQHDFSEKWHAFAG